VDEAMRMLPEHRTHLIARRATVEALQHDWKETLTASTAIATKLEAVKKQVHETTQQDLAYVDKLRAHFQRGGDVSVYKHIQNIIDSDVESPVALDSGRVLRKHAGRPDAHTQEIRNRRDPLTPPTSPSSTVLPEGRAEP